jgi:hypothetical protein
MLNIKIKEIIYLINLSARASGSLGRRQACDGAAAGARHNYVENALSLTPSAAALMQQQQKCRPPRAAKTVENSLFGSVNVGKLQEKKLWSGFLPLCGFVASGCRLKFQLEFSVLRRNLGTKSSAFAWLHNGGWRVQ